LLVVKKFWQPQPPGAFRACPVSYRDSFTLLLLLSSSSSSLLFQNLMPIRNLQGGKRL
jgi:hypothetical protein